MSDTNLHIQYQKLKTSGWTLEHYFEYILPTYINQEKLQLIEQIEKEAEYRPKCVFIFKGTSHTSNKTKVIPLSTLQKIKESL